MGLQSYPEYPFKNLVSSQHIFMEKQARQWRVWLYLQVYAYEKSHDITFYTFLIHFFRLFSKLIIEKYRKKFLLTYIKLYNLYNFIICFFTITFFFIFDYSRRGLGTQYKFKKKHRFTTRSYEMCGIRLKNSALCNYNNIPTKHDWFNYGCFFLCVCEIVYVCSVFPPFDDVLSCGSKIMSDLILLLHFQVKNAIIFRHSDIHLDKPKGPLKSTIKCLIA